jgi:hypothetical protein
MGRSADLHNLRAIIGMGKGYSRRCGSRPCRAFRDIGLVHRGRRGGVVAPHQQPRLGDEALKTSPVRLTMRP